MPLPFQVLKALSPSCSQLQRSGLRVGGVPLWEKAILRQTLKFDLGMCVSVRSSPPACEAFSLSLRERGKQPFQQLSRGSSIVHSLAVLLSYSLLPNTPNAVSAIINILDVYPPSRCLGPLCMGHEPHSLLFHYINYIRLYIRIK